MTFPEGSLRVFPEIRSLHIDDLNAGSPRPTLYFSRYYELAEDRVPSDWQEVDLAGAVRNLWRHPPKTLELYEPLWPGFVLRWFLLAAVYKLRVRGRGTVAFFAIQNNDLVALAPGPRVIRPLTQPLMRRGLAILLPGLVDRVVYGTDDTADLYRAFIGSRPNGKVILSLRASRLTTAPEKEPGSAAFVGALQSRKGLPLLLAAWPEVERAEPHARLVIVGDGALRARVIQWCAEKPESRTYLGLLERSEVLETLAPTAMLVVPSQRVGRWREQVNGAILEALSSGCTVVTTTETGLADWLMQAGHTVLPPDASSSSLAQGMLAALRNPIPPQRVLESLPAVDGRIQADHWLHQA
jgi:glycosyltransferase involved in cell wall biosynthesis